MHIMIGGRRIANVTREEKDRNLKAERQRKWRLTLSNTYSNSQSHTLRSASDPIILQMERVLSLLQHTILKNVYMSTSERKCQSSCHLGAGNCQDLIY